MGDSPPPEGDAANAQKSTTTNPPRSRQVISIDREGDIVLDVVFETSIDTLRKSRKIALAAARRAGSSALPLPELKTKVEAAYRVNLETLKRNSKYFTNLLYNPQFQEAKTIEYAHDALRARGADPKKVDAGDLPWIKIADDDEASKAAGREHVFEDLLLMMHSKPIKTTKLTMPYVTTLAITADRFDCTPALSRALNGEYKFKWPLTTGKPMRDENGRATEAEQLIRQKILVAWLLGQPMRLHNATRELIMRGSSHWSAFHDEAVDSMAAWCTLPDGLEHELQYRRECILNTIASVQRHFLKLYSSKDRQCKLGYDSSPACDSFQLGQLLRFLVSKNLLSLVDFSPDSLDAVPDTSMADIDDLLATLRQFPAYQVDRHHINCGPRVRAEPVFEYIRAMVGASVVSIPFKEWRGRRSDVSWVVTQTAGEGDEDSTFKFTRALANDKRLRVEGAMFADKMAKKLFTSESWDWTPEL
ncbi:uncharacterized protein J7T54_003732 [Emericellopsis cladophorae]|uniref:Uncharacterized protein n=1 Tax=Emericellopsis cladophorae TaxID=2686198 RepID=A0A9P9XYE5_9HYPO|nr:uncharacterized protein J7T54_003732 [Emericellopsis cladophorae]KAI6779808.1 hypothetical protein J7T54_003732 [Emericellopsis cladophorae]